MVSLLNIVTPIIDIGATRIKRIDAKSPLTNYESHSFADVVHIRKTTPNQLEPKSILHYNPRNTSKINLINSKITPRENETQNSDTVADIDTSTSNQLAAKITLTKNETIDGTSTRKRFSFQDTIRDIGNGVGISRSIPNPIDTNTTLENNDINVVATRITPRITAIHNANPSRTLDRNGIKYQWNKSKRRSIAKKKRIPTLLGRATDTL